MSNLVKIISISAAAVAVVGLLAYISTNNENRHSLNFATPSETTQDATTTANDSACNNLNSVIIDNFSNMIKTGPTNPKFNEWTENVKTNNAAMDMNRCQKDKLYSYIQKNLTINNNLYFELQGLIE